MWFREEDQELVTLWNLRGLVGSSCFVSHALFPHLSQAIAPPRWAASGTTCFFMQSVSLLCKSKPDKVGERFALFPPLNRIHCPRNTPTPPTPRTADQYWTVVPGCREKRHNLHSLGFIYNLFLKEVLIWENYWILSIRLILVKSFRHASKIHPLLS